MKTLIIAAVLLVACGAPPQPDPVGPLHTCTMPDGGTYPACGTPGRGQ